MIGKGDGEGQISQKDLGQRKAGSVERRARANCESVRKRAKYVDVES